MTRFDMGRDSLAGNGPSRAPLARPGEGCLFTLRYYMEGLRK
jgi:hypothetical protein